MSKPNLRVNSVTIGTSKPHELAHFYAKLLAREVGTMDPPGPDEPTNGGWAQVRANDGETGPTLNFEFERCFRRPVWPAVQGEQTASQHLDILVDDLPSAVEWAIECGARPAEFQPQETVRVMIDSDGHPFCLFL